MPAPHVHKLKKEQVVVFKKKKAFNSDSNYLKGTARIKGVDDIDVRAPLPETFSFGTANEVNQTFDFMKFKSQAIQVLSAGVVKGNYDRGLSERNFWRSIENKDITVELNFAAYYSGEIDVVQPIVDLMTLGAPVETLGRPDFGFGWDAPPLINVLVGDVLYFTDALIKNIDVVFSNKLDHEFNPMSAQVSVTFITSNPIGWAGIKGYTGDVSGFSDRYK